MSLLLLAKLFVAPAFVIAVTLVGRRLGPSVAGLLAAFPVVAGPILGLIVAEQGAAFATQAALAGAVGAASTMIFTLVFAHLATRVGAAANLALSYGVFGVVTLLFGLVPTSIVTAATVPYLTWAAVLRFFRVPDGDLPSIRPSRWDLPARAITTMVLVVAITGVARAVGPKFAGLITPAPIATAVLAVFTQRESGADAVAVLLRSLTRGLASFSTFFVGCGLFLPRFAAPIAFGLALVAAIVVQAIVLRTGLGAPHRPLAPVASGGRP